MSNVTFKGTEVKLGGKFPQVGNRVQDFKLTGNDLNDVTLHDFKNHRLIMLNIFPSLDTGTCAESVIRFNKEASDMHDTAILCISKDLPFAQARFCGVEDIKNAKTLSAFRNPEFGEQYGVDILDSPVRGLLARAVILLDQEFKILYTELVSEITHKPNYEACLDFIKTHSK
jgi:thioredoxin-dependent peroxiredoxin